MHRRRVEVWAHMFLPRVKQPLHSIAHADRNSAGAQPARDAHVGACVDVAAVTHAGGMHAGTYSHILPTATSEYAGKTPREAARSSRSCIWNQATAQPALQLPRPGQSSWVLQSCRIQL